MAKKSIDRVAHIPQPFLVYVAPEIPDHSVQFGLSDPEMADARPGYPPVLGRRASVRRHIVWGELVQDEPHIRAAAIQSIPVSVVHIDTIARMAPHQFSVQANGMLSMLGLSRGPFGIAIGADAPAPLVHVGSVGFIDPNVARKATVTVNGDEYATLGGHQGNLLVSSPGVLDALPGASCMVAEGVV
jgi:hypothetical protein